MPHRKKPHKLYTIENGITYRSPQKPNGTQRPDKYVKGNGHQV